MKSLPVRYRGHDRHLSKYQSPLNSQDRAPLTVYNIYRAGYISLTLSNLLYTINIRFSIKKKNPAPTILIIYIKKIKQAGINSKYKQGPLFL